jgi:hypothetical protein
MDEAAPVEVVDMSLGTSSHKTSGHNWPAIEPSFFIELFAMDQSAGSLALSVATGFLHDEPFREPPDADPLGRLTGITLVGRWCK